MVVHEQPLVAMEVHGRFRLGVCSYIWVMQQIIKISKTGGKLACSASQGDLLPEQTSLQPVFEKEIVLR